MLFLGLCLNTKYVNDTYSAFILDANCTTSNLMFQKVRHFSGESFLIKDLNGDCAQIVVEPQNRKLYCKWRKCQAGGFTILQMSRKGNYHFL